MAFDPVRGVVYMTEDNFGFPSGLYRYLPDEHPLWRRRIGNGGRLQMLAVRGVPKADLAATQPDGRHVPRRPGSTSTTPTRPSPTRPGQTAPTTNNDAISYVGNQGRAQGAAWFSRLEGARLRPWHRLLLLDPGRWAGRAGSQRHRPGLRQRVRPGVGVRHVRVAAAARLPVTRPRRARLPRQRHDEPPRARSCCARTAPATTSCAASTRQGELFDIALNRLVSSTGTPRFGDEFAGSTFSPDGRTLFVNIQASRGMTFAIWGPWGRIGV